MEIKFAVPVCAMIISCYSYSEQFKISEKIIKTKISYQNLNRISVKGDKIDTIVGIDTAFHFQKNEKSGEVFIRPTEENGYNPISLSIITTSGQTQDLLLEIIDGDAHSIELIADTAVEMLLNNTAILQEYTNNDYEESISFIMKKFINISAGRIGQKIEIPNRRYLHLMAKFESAYQIDGFLCLKYTITTEKKGQFRLEERMFSRQGDIALSLSKLSIKKNESATLYVIRR